MSIAIAHPRAPAAPAREEGRAPYLLRGDDLVLPYHEGLAQLPGFRPLLELPRWHVERIEAARAREAAAQQALEERAAAQQAADALAVDRALVAEATSRQALRELCARHEVKTDGRQTLAQLRELAEAALRRRGAA